MSNRILRRAFFLATVLGAAGLLGGRRGFAAPKSYKYRCPKCKLIQEYGTMGVKKCPNDGATMLRMN